MKGIQLPPVAENHINLKLNYHLLLQTLLINLLNNIIIPYFKTTNFVKYYCENSLLEFYDDPNIKLQTLRKLFYKNSDFS